MQDFLWPLRAGLQVVTILAVFNALPFLLALAVREGEALRVAEAVFLAAAGVAFFLETAAVVFFFALDLLSVFFFFRSLPFTGSDFCAVGVLACPVACANGVNDNDVNSNAQSVNDHFLSAPLNNPLSMQAKHPCLGMIYKTQRF